MVLGWACYSDSRSVSGSSPCPCCTERRCDNITTAPMLAAAAFKWKWTWTHRVVRTAQTQDPSGHSSVLTIEYPSILNPFISTCSYCSYRHRQCVPNPNHPLGEIKYSLCSKPVTPHLKPLFMDNSTEGGKVCHSLHDLCLS